MNTARITLRGMTWDHPRGYDPLVATAAAFNAKHPDIAIVWEKRSLRAFEEFPIERLAADYDLIVIDHPFVGFAAKHGPLVPLDEHLPAAFLADQAAHSVGASHASYAFAGSQWALATDAATPIMFWRDDLVAALRLELPCTWDDLLALARRGHVEVPAAPINCLMHFFMLVVAHGETPCTTSERVVSGDTGRWVLARLRELLAACDAGVWSRNPIGSHELVAAQENTQIAIGAFAYGYSNYARDGFAAHRLTFGDLPTFERHPLCSTLGGTGLAVSALRPHRAAALAYAQFTASAEVQRTIYTVAGGQPGHRGAWLDPENNRLTHDLFTRTLPTLDRAWVRPRYCGYLEFQEKAGPVVHAALRGTINDADALAELDHLYRASQQHATLPA